MNNSSLNSERHRINLLGVKVDPLSLSELLETIQNCINGDKKVFISYANIHALNIAYSNRWFRDFLNQSYITFCDGNGLRLAAWLTRQYLPHRFTPPDFIENIAEQAQLLNWKIFLLGARPDVAQQAAGKLIEKFPGIHVETHHGYFNKTKDSEENMQVIAQINQFLPQILIIGFGMPIQEKWILENFADLQINIAFPAGAMLDYLGGEVRRAPRWMTDNGLEWLGRLMIEPGRLWRRYLLGNPLFLWRIFIHHMLGFSLPN